MYIWNQKEEIAFLNKQTIEQNSKITDHQSTLKKHLELINAQREYIKVLEMQYNNPLHKPPPNPYYDPI